MLYFGIKYSVSCGKPETLKLWVCQLQNVIRTTFVLAKTSTAKVQIKSAIKWQPKKQCENSTAQSCLLKTFNV